MFDNGALLSFSSLHALTDIGGVLYVESNSALTTLDGLDALTRVGSELFLFDNASMTTLGGLDALTEIGAGLLIQLPDAFIRARCSADFWSLSASERPDPF